MSPSSCGPACDEYAALRAAFAAGCRGGAAAAGAFRLCHFAVLNDHLHLIVEAHDRQSLSRGLQGLLIRIARKLNKLWRRKGKVFADRYHDHILKSPRETRNALRYVLQNARHHAAKGRMVDASSTTDTFTSAPWFDGFRQTIRVRGLEAIDRPITAPPHLALDDRVATPRAARRRRNSRLNPASAAGPPCAQTRQAGAPRALGVRRTAAATSVGFRRARTAPSQPCPVLPGGWRCRRTPIHCPQLADSNQLGSVCRGSVLPAAPSTTPPMRIQTIAAGTSTLLGVAMSHAVAQSPMPGHRLVVPLASPSTHLVDDTGTIVHTWTSTYNAGTAAYVLADGSLLRAIASAATSTTLPGTGGGVQRIGWDGTLLWDFRFANGTQVSHHDLAPMPNGNVLLLVWEDKTAAEAIAAGRDPALMSGSVFRPDAIYEVQPTGPTSGQVVWSWHMWDHLIQDFDPAQGNYGAVAAHAERLDINFPPYAQQANDFNHCNGIDYDPIHDWIVISAPHQAEVYILDHSTTTAEAAGSTGGRRGRGGDLLYRWGNPQAYRAGTWVDQQLFFQHDPRFIPPGSPGEGNLTVFNNQLSATNSAVVELVLPVDQSGNFVLWSNGRYGPLFPIWNYTAPNFASGIISGAQRLANGNTLVCSGVQGRVFEVTSGGREVWNWQAPPGQFVFHAHWVDRTLWTNADSLASSGASVSFDLLMGSRHAGAVYLLLAGMSGSSPGFQFGNVTVPLNPDPLVFASAEFADSPVFQNTLGLLGSLGDATATVNVNQGMIPPAFVGTQLHLAAIVADPATLVTYRASNPVPLRIVP